MVFSAYLVRVCSASALARSPAAWPPMASATTSQAGTTSQTYGEAVCCQ